MTVLTYDDIGIPFNGLQGGVVGPGFTEQGYVFNNTMVVIDLGSGLFPDHAFSGGYAALNDYPGPGVITNPGAGLFTFDSTMIEGWNTEWIDGTITGYLNGQALYSIPFHALGPDAGGGRPTGVWTQVSGNSTLVDTLVISGGTFVLDNTSLTDPPAVPIPTTLPLMLTGLMLLLLLLRKAPRLRHRW